jgi:GntR family histidine utilization transcriptional repressor
MTVNKAISSLAAAGLIVRRRRSGSFVALPRIEEPLLTIKDIPAEVRSSGRAYRFEVRQRGLRSITDALEANRIGVPLRTRMLNLELVHYADDLPFTLESRQINVDAVPDAASEPFEESPPGTWLLRHVPWTDGEHSLEAVAADEATAKELRIAPGTACIAIARRTWRAGELITMVRFVHPGERHRFVVRFSAGATGAARRKPQP